MACARCVEGHSGRDCGFTAAEAQARSAMQDMLLERISNLTMAANGSGGGSSTSVRSQRPAKCDWQGRSDWVARELRLCDQCLPDGLSILCTRDAGRWTLGTSTSGRGAAGGAAAVHCHHIFSGPAVCARSAGCSKHSGWCGVGWLRHVQRAYRSAKVSVQCHLPVIDWCFCCGLLQVAKSLVSIVSRVLVSSAEASVAAPAASRELHLAQARALVSEDTSKWVRGAMLRVGDALTANLAPGSPVVTLTALDRASQRAMTVRESVISCDSSCKPLTHSQSRSLHCGDSAWT